MRRSPRFPPTQATFYALDGGLNLVTPAIRMDPGYVFGARNYEPAVGGGYRRINGFERSDGQPSPSSADYWIIDATMTDGATDGSTLTGATSGATGRVLAIAGETIVLGRVSGTFIVGESLQVSAVTIGTATTTASQNGAMSLSDHVDYRLLAADDLRADILQVPGSGQIRGGFIINDVCHAFRDNAAGTAGDLYKQTSSGWQRVSLGRELQFTGAVGEITDGQTVTGATSGASAVVRRALLRTGTWSSSGAGTLVFASVTGTFQNGENVQVGGVTKVSASGADTDITRLPGGRVETVKDNLIGSLGSRRIYGVDGVNLAFEFDGTYYVPIRTGQTTDTPSHVASHKSRLWMSFGPSLQYSGVNSPYGYSVLTGANEIAMGDTIGALRTVAGNTAGAALAVFTSTRTSVVYGSTNSDFNLVPSIDSLGYYAYTVQPVGNDLYGLTNNGIQSLITTLNYGDFEYAARSYLIEPLILSKRGLQTTSVVLRQKSQYRLFFSDNTAVVVGLTGNKVSGLLPLEYTIPVRCAWTDTLSTGLEVCFFGSDDGYVYQDNIGTSFDGDPIEAFVRPVFNNLDAPRVRKQYRQAVFEATCEGYAQVNATYDLGYATFGVAPAAVQPDLSLRGAGGYWDSFTWDQFNWDSPVVADARLSIDGTETNISFLFYSNRAQDDSHIVSGVNLLYTPRRLVRSGS